MVKFALTLVGPCSRPVHSKFESHNVYCMMFHAGDAGSSFVKLVHGYVFGEIQIDSSSRHKLQAAACRMLKAK